MIQQTYISPKQRYTRYHPCPICGGFASLPQGRGERCAGYLSTDGEYAYCTREEYAGSLERNENTEPPAFGHKFYGPCNCGKEHNPARVSSNGHKPHASNSEGRPRIVAEYSYQEEHGRMSYQSVRYDPKDFRQRQPDGKGGWIWNMQGVTLVPFHLPELLRAHDATVFIPEGEKDVLALEHIGLVATTNVGGAGKWRKDYNHYLQGRHVVILPDNDEAGRKHAAQVIDSLRSVAASIRMVNLPHLPEKGDVSDWLESGGTKERLLQFVDLAPNPVLEKSTSTSKTISLKTLMSMQLTPMQWVIPDILPEGLTLLCSKPKLGKSWLSLGIGLDTASGGYALGKKQVERGEVLLLALEDPTRRLQSRVKTILASERYQRSGIPEGLEIATEWPRIGKGGIEALDQWINDHPQARLIIVDTWAKLAPKAEGRKQVQYEEDYEALTPLKKLADKHRIAILAVHHLRKMGSEDILDQVTGSTGLTGACDGFLVLKRERGRFDAELFVTGRDIEDEQIYKLSFDKVGAIWTLEGNVEDLARGTVQQEILDLLKENPDGLSVKEVAENLDNKNFYTTRTLLNRLVEQGKLAHVQNRYKCVVSVVSVVPVVSVVDNQAPESEQPGAPTDYTSSKNYTDYSDYSDYTSSHESLFSAQQPYTDGPQTALEAASLMHQWVDIPRGRGQIVHVTSDRVDIDIMGKIYSLHGPEIPQIRVREAVRA